MDPYFYILGRVTFCALIVFLVPVLVIAAAALYWKAVEAVMHYTGWTRKIIEYVKKVNDRGGPLSLARSNGKTPLLHGGDRGSIPRRGTNPGAW